MNEYYKTANLKAKAYGDIYKNGIDPGNVRARLRERLQEIEEMLSYRLGLSIEEVSQFVYKLHNLKNQLDRGQNENQQVSL